VLYQGMLFNCHLRPSQANSASESTPFELHPIDRLADLEFSLASLPTTFFYYSAGQITINTVVEFVHTASIRASFYLVWLVLYCSGSLVNLEVDGVKRFFNIEA
jgi:hypothetical protein